MFYYFRPSHGRYLFSLSPLIVLFALQFYNNYSSNNRWFYRILTVFLFFGLLFEVNYYIFKFIIFIVSVALLFFIVFRNKKYVFLLVLFITLISSGSALLAMITLDGAEIQTYLKYGRNEQIATVYDKVDINKNIYSNMNNLDNARAYKRVKVQDYFYAQKRVLKDIFPKKRNA